MARPEKVLDADEGTLARFALDLRQLRHDTGGITYREMAKRVNYSATVLSEAAAGRKLPTLPVTLAYVQACGGDPLIWTQRWQAVADEVRDDKAVPAAVPHPSVRRRPVAIGLAVAMLLAIVAVVGAIVLPRQPGGVATPEDVAARDSTTPVGTPVEDSPAAGLPCSTLPVAHACVDAHNRVVWVKDLPPGDGHHAAIYWTANDGSAYGQCHNYLSADGPWVTCPYPAPHGAVAFRVAVVEKETVLEWGPHVTVK